MKSKVIAVAIGTLLTYWGISLGKSLSSSEESRVKIEKIPAADFKNPDEKAPESSATWPPSGDNRAPASIAEPSVQPTAKFEFQHEMDSYLLLKAMLFPSEEQTKERQEILKNARMLKSIAQRLIQQPLLNLEQQDLAVDILLEALKDGDVGAAQEALAAVVSDSQVENASLEQPVREQLAGVKAEVLYHWGASLPHQLAHLASLLPGPVSKKIWDNVMKNHQSNLAQSESELKN